MGTGTDVNEHDGRHDFDFLFGAWNVYNRRLVSRFQDCIEWETFAATAVISPILGGLGHVDEMTVSLPGGDLFRGFTLRLFDSVEKVWSIYWADSRTGRLFPPLNGRFEGAIGHFYGTDIEGGTPVSVHFTWTVLGSGAAKWEQEMSQDDGRTWEKNWEMNLTCADS